MLPLSLSLAMGFMNSAVTCSVLEWHEADGATACHSLVTQAGGSRPHGSPKLPAFMERPSLSFPMLLRGSDHIHRSSAWPRGKGGEPCVLGFYKGPQWSFLISP